jgi:hypothetical protein
MGAISAAMRLPCVRRRQSRNPRPRPRGAVEWPCRSVSATHAAQCSTVPVECRDSCVGLSVVTCAVLSFSRDRSRCGIKSCNPKNQIWDKSRNQWYLSHSGCAIKSGIHTTFLAHNCGSTARLGSRRIHAESHQTRIGQVAPRRVHELVQRTLDGSVQRPSPEADRARPAATVPPWMHGQTGD